VLYGTSKRRANQLTLNHPRCSNKLARLRLSSIAYTLSAAVNNMFNPLESQLQFGTTIVFQHITSSAIPSMNSLPRPHVSPFQHVGVLACCAAFAIANVIVPLTLGDVYPFTVAPMFRDAPQHYANHRVFSPAGEKIADNSRRALDSANSADPFLLRRYYDGNPVGCGVGICPPKTLDEFGVVPDEQTVRAHIAKHWPSELKYKYVEVEQEIIGPIDAQRVGVQRTHRWRMERPQSADSQAVQP
jgi:hypothetical protein